MWQCYEFPEAGACLLDMWCFLRMIEAFQATICFRTEDTTMVPKNQWLKCNCMPSSSITELSVIFTITHYSAVSK